MRRDDGQGPGPETPDPTPLDLATGSTVGGLGEEDLAAWVAASCARHEVPVRVTDTVVIARVAVLLSDGTPARPGRPAVVLQAPDRVGPVRVEPLGAGCAGGDDDVIEDRGDDRVLPGQSQVGPLTA